MTLLDAPQYDPSKAKRRKIQIALAIVMVLVLAVVGWLYRNWPEEHAVDRFFAALQKQDYETAYGIYFHDSEWRQHLQKYSQYTYADFYRDWGPGGEWGLVKSHRIYGSASSKDGVVVEVVVNDRADRARMFVLKDKTLTVFPY
ncbi:MAG TPA: hypothetical protein VLT90_16865 [Terriglobales bacterium]|nr:hypothetical protein [Terriglobales bacterium]